MRNAILLAMLTGPFVLGIGFAAPADDFVKKVESTIPWAAIKGDFTKHAESYDEIGREFQSFSMDEARHVVKVLQEHSRPEKGGDVYAESRIYVLLRFYFAVPEFEEPKKAKFFVGFSVPVDDNGKVNVLWPLIRTKDKSLHLGSRFGQSLGPPYDALGEFEYFAKLYGPRESAKK